MYTHINNDVIRSFAPCYDPHSVGGENNEDLTPKEWLGKYRYNAKNPRDLLWIFCRTDFLSDNELSKFYKWCAHEARKVVGDSDSRVVKAQLCAEKPTLKWDEGQSGALHISVRAICSVTREKHHIVFDRFLDELITYFE